MIILILGVLLWWVAHLMKRLAPGSRAALQDRMGDASKGLFAILIILSVVLMTIGYQNYTGQFFWGRNAALVGINNLLMLVAIYLFACSGARTRVTKFVRHPQLTAFKAWAVAHLLVNGDTASFILFGGLLAWAVVSVIVINRQTERPAPAESYPIKKEVTAIVATLVVYGLVSAIHIWLGYNPFGA
ncbi:MAG: NnrU family protein [Pseudomonadota bacterium]